MSRKSKMIRCCLIAVFLVFCVGKASLGAQNLKSTYVVILGYQIRNMEDTASLETILPGDTVLIKVHLLDPRNSVQEYDSIRAVIKEQNFVPIKAASELNGDVQIEKNGMALTLIFPVKFVGDSNQLSFEYSYTGSLSTLDKDNVKITIIQCKEEGLPGESDGQSDESELETDSETESLDESESESIPDPPLENGAGFTGGATDATSTNNEKVSRMSQFLVKAVDYGDTSVTAGMDFDCKITVMVTQGDESISNSLIALSLPYGISFADNTDRVYLGTLDAGKCYDVVFHLHVDESLSQKKATLKVHLTGSSSYSGISLEKEDDIEISTAPIEHLTINNLVLPDKINAAYDDGAGWLQFTLTNKGYAPVSDVKVSIEGESFSETDPFVIEELKESSSETVNLNLITNMEGTLEGNIFISYTNASGEFKQIREPIKVEAEYRKAEINHDIVINPELIQEKPLLPDWVWVIVTMGAIVGLAIFIKKFVFKLRE